MRPDRYTKVFQDAFGELDQANTAWIKVGRPTEGPEWERLQSARSDFDHIIFAGDVFEPADLDIGFTLQDES